MRPFYIYKIISSGKLLGYRCLRRVMSTVRDGTETLPPPKLVLHFDVNETIMIGDPAGGDTFEDSLNKIICKSAFVLKSSIVAGMPTQWRDGSPIVCGGAAAASQASADSNTKESASANECDAPDLYTGWEWPEGTVPFYRAGRRAKMCAQTFTEAGNPGEAYRPLFHKLEKALRWPKGNMENKCDNELKRKSAEPPSKLCHDGVHHFLVPAFFRTICELANRGRPFGVVIRTFGTDADRVVDALEAFAEGFHLDRFSPVVPEMSVAGNRATPGCPQMETNVGDNVAYQSSCWKGSYAKDGTFHLQSYGGTDTSSCRRQSINDEDTIVRILYGIPGDISCAVCTDDYDWWRNHGYKPSAGKPLWIDYGCMSNPELASRPPYLPIFFDDNIHNDPCDSIVAVRSKALNRDDGGNMKYEPMSGKETLQQQGVHLVRVPTVEPILNQNWFLEQIDLCEAAWSARMTKLRSMK